MLERNFKFYVYVSKDGQNIYFTLLNLVETEDLCFFNQT